MSYVYFIACEPMEAVKIGFTKTYPVLRLAALQTGCPARLKLLAYVPASIDEERRLHEAFAPLHIQGEWFRLEGKLQDMIFYFDGNGRQSSRETFENSLHDVLMQGLWHPDSPITQDAYSDTGDWKPFRDLLWTAFGPWEECE
jgi:hypothetical protein